jgi:hypothetical protein
MEFDQFFLHDSVTVGHGGVRFDQGGDDCLGNFRMRFRRLVPMNMDSPGSGPGQAQVKSGMTERGRKNPGSFSRPSPRAKTRGPFRTAEEFQEYFQAIERSHI